MHPIAQGGTLLLLLCWIAGCATPPGDAPEPTDAQADAWFEELREARAAHAQGQLEGATEALMRAVELSLDFPDEHPQQLANLETIRLILSSWWEAGDRTRTLEIAREIILLCDERAPPARTLELEMLHLQGQLELGSGSPEAAADIFYVMRKKSRGRGEAGAYYSVIALISLAGARLQEGDSEQAVELAARAVKEAEEEFGIDHVTTAAVLLDQGNILFAVGAVDAANESLERALAAQRSYYGAASPDNVPIVIHLAQQYFSIYEYARAGAYAEEALDLIEAHYGEAHPDVIIPASVLARIHTRRGEFELAIPLAKQVLADAGEIFGPRSAPYASSLYQLAAIELEAGNYLEARKRLLETAGLEETLRGGPNPGPGLDARLAECEAGLGNFDEADALFVGALESARREAGESSLLSAEHAVRLARYRIERGQLEEAAALLPPGLALLLDGRRPPDTLLVQALEAQATLAEALGDAISAHEAARSTLEMGSLVFGEDSPRRAQLADRLRETLRSMPPSHASPEGDLEGMRQGARAEEGAPIVSTSPELGFRFELSGSTWHPVEVDELGQGIHLALVHHSPKITFTLGAEETTTELRANLGIAPGEDVDTGHLAVAFEESLRIDAIEVLRQSERSVGGAKGVEFIYQVKGQRGAAYYVTWIAVERGVAYQLRTWARARRISIERVIQHAHDLQQGFSVTDREQAGAP